MIRKIKVEDIESVIITSLHSARLGEKNYNIVKHIYSSNTKTCVCEEDAVIKGFISISDDSFIGTLFVDSAYQGQEIGQVLINTTLNQYKLLSLAVYKYKVNSIYFYKK
ncbi:GNAT family N-acetyltransferase [Turicibacter bilis]|uniref:GNAT family N-acetyltransferase n=1 Tax=Turicibacter bilis TaxID=2735723 RepID=A0A9Q9CSN4_9FIRM|nr:GNAT family N-acetyltransferase [Turicibacter bilis]MBS3197287.1 GNAT family N-acetyltransferase [Turicibacter bilis]UUF09098.1 GNAT family N-acetyltransferase [Turicibacter bilis]